MHERMVRALVARKVAETAVIEEALQRQEHADRSPVVALLDAGVVDEETLVNVLSEIYGLSVVFPGGGDPAVATSIPHKFAREHLVLPILRCGDTLTLAMVDPMDVMAEDSIRAWTGYAIRRVLCRRSELLKAIEQFHVPSRALEAVEEDPEELVEVAADSAEEAPETDHDAPPVVKLVNVLLEESLRQRASDIHVEPAPQGLRVRYRVDGLLRDAVTLPRALIRPVTSRFKIIAQMDISESRKPQDGRTSLRVGGRTIDFRVSSLPTHLGEKIVLRILDREKVMLTLDRLGFLADDFDLMHQFLDQPQGMLIITGPTGSGKTSTLYSALHHICSESTNIITVEDPVEFQLPGISQVQINERAGLTFASALRAILRQDPNVVMVGEIRDLETAEIAFQAAMTGHFVLSTLHTNDAPSTINRLGHMGLEPYLVASSLLGVVAQRLARTICADCREPAQASEQTLRRLRLYAPDFVPPDHFFQGRGCSHCQGSGYRGRTGLYEILTVTDAIKELIFGRASEGEIRRAAQGEGMRLLMDDGLIKAVQGITTVDELLRNCPVAMKPREERRREHADGGTGSRAAGCIVPFPQAWGGEAGAASHDRRILPHRGRAVTAR